MAGDDGEVGAYMIQDALDEVRDFLENDEWTKAALLEFFARNFPPEWNVAAQDYLFESLEKGIDFGAPEFRDRMERDIWRYFAERLKTLDPFTQTGAMGFGVRKAASEIEFDDLSPAFFIKGMSAPGSFGTISGKTNTKKKEGSKKLGVGKTASALIIGKMYADAKYAVATNIPFKGTYPGITAVRTLKELVIHCLENMRNGKATLAILDEFSQYISKELANKKEWVDLKKLLYLFRKFGILLLVITQREIEIPNAIMEMGSVHIQKVSQTRMNFRKGSDHFRISKVPDSPIPFATFTPGMFRVDDLQVEPFYDAIFAAEKEGRPIIEAALEFLNNPRALTKSERMACAKVLWVNGHGQISQNQIGSVIGESQRTVSNWLKGMGLDVEEANA
jgi:hypothetical protein